MLEAFRTNLIEAYRIGTSHAKYPEIMPSEVIYKDTASIYEEVIRTYEG